MMPNIVVKPQSAQDTVHSYFFIRCSYHGFMKVDLRISIKDYRRDINLKIKLMLVRGVFLCRLPTVFRKSLVKSGEAFYAAMLRSGANMWRSARARCSPARATQVRARRKRTRLRFLNAGRDERAGNDEGGPERH
jgi:hypothetical protein